MEANAAMALLNHVPEEVSQELRSLVQYLCELMDSCCALLCVVATLVVVPHPFAFNSRQYSMQKFLTHDAIASGMFSAGECCAASTQSAWADALTLTPENLKVLVERMHADYSNLPSKLRKTWTTREIVTSLSLWLISFCHMSIAKKGSDMTSKTVSAINSGTSAKGKLLVCGMPPGL